MKKISHTSIILCMLLILACQSDKSGYLMTIPDFPTFEYFSADIESIRADTLKPALFYSTEHPEIFMQRPTDIIRLGDRYWVSDPFLGNVFSTNPRGEHWKTIATRGHGPGEVRHPAVFFHDLYDVDRGHLLDTSAKCIVSYTTGGIEIGRICSNWIHGEFFSAHAAHYDSDRYLITINNHEESLLGIIDQNGELVETLVPRIIPAGYQPVTHNRVTFAYDKNRNLLTYAYKGIPAVFIKKADERYLVNLMPKKSLHEINTPLDLLPMDAQVGVKNLIRNLHILDDRLFIHFNISLVVFNLKDKRIERQIVFLNDEGMPFGVHEMKVTGDRVFLINGHTSEIYSVEISEIERALPPITMSQDRI